MDIPTIGQLHMWRYTARAQARKFTARPGGQWLQQWVGPTAPRRAASGQYARAPRIRNINRNVRSTVQVTVAYILDITYNYRENVALKSQVWGSLTLAQ